MRTDLYRRPPRGMVIGPRAAGLLLLVVFALACLVGCERKEPELETMGPHTTRALVDGEWRMVYDDGAVRCTWTRRTPISCNFTRPETPTDD